MGTGCESKDCWNKHVTDWEHAFKYATPTVCGSHEHGGVEQLVANKLSGIGEPFEITDVSKVIAIDHIHGIDYADDDMLGVFQLKNSHFVSLRASSDSSGWG